MAEIKHLTSLDGLSLETIHEILEDAEQFSKGKKVAFDDTVVANLFFEDSTRTQYSFEMAQLKTGIKPLTFNAATSSINKGESLYDTVKLFETIGAKAVVIRHPENNYFDGLTDSINIPILNGGDGSGNHPSQSLLDLLTIKQQFKTFDGLKIAIVGDIANSRVAHTNISVMKRLGMDVHLVAPDMFQEPGYTWENLDDIIGEMDIIMLLRIQHERHSDKNDFSITDYHQSFGLTVAREKEMKKEAIIMHPAPFNRGVEIASELVECERSRIFKQMENGVYVRMAILNWALSD